MGGHWPAVARHGDGRGRSGVESLPQDAFKGALLVPSPEGEAVREGPLLTSPDQLLRSKLIDSSA